MFKKIIIKTFFGKKIFQRFFEWLHIISLSGMNIGGGSGVENSGEKEVIKYIAQHIKRDTMPIVFDVGANKGDYSLEILSTFKDKVKLYCFEPSKETFNLLISNLKEYKDVKMYNFGFDQSNRISALYSDRKGSGLASVFNRKLDHFNTQLKNKEKIELKRIDDFCRDNAINHIDLLKLDVEGNELNIFKGAEKLINSSSIDFIQFEFGECNIDSRTFFQDFFYLLNPYYKIYRILKDGLMPIDIYETTLESFLTTNFLAISRKYEKN